MDTPNVNESCRDNLERTLLAYIDENVNSSQIVFNCEILPQRQCDYDIRKCVSDDLKSKILRKGFEYRANLSTRDYLVFRSIENQSLKV